jgi:hypothetical protein
VGEEVREGNIIAKGSGTPRADWAVVRHGSAGKEGRYARGRASTLDSRDPLGLCRFGDEVVRRGSMMFKILGGVGVLGALVVAAVRVSGVEGWLNGQLPEGGVWAWVTGAGE